MSNKRKHMGYAEDRLVSPFVVYEDLRTHTKYVDFPFANDRFLEGVGPDDPITQGEPPHQKRRYYTDERLITLEEFNKMRKP